MALQLVCDGGCGTTLQIDTKPIGRLEPAFYCPGCREAWETHVMAEERKREELIVAFEGWRTSALGDMRKRLGKLPDD